ncbi:DNA recombination protein RmuC [Ramlibacter sp. G-1-2-2]|uniref:DNA recombination protein RmuC n=1 Tax=Ramlibacter agri TaxID=2728837 RepID=A0A848HFC7_9BURK|nr:DNA recombination protein RmuC [Ramlibacter agri]NML48041.1 DNA recombination protein RmuC [Ramlibacter agri]
MTETHFFILLALGIVPTLLLLALLLRKLKFETPADLSARLGLLEQVAQGLVQAVSRNEGGMQRIEQQLRGFTEATAAAMAVSKTSLDEQLERTVGEARNGRSELNQAFHAFEGRLGHQVAALSTSVGERVIELQRTTMDSLETSRKVVDEKLAQTLDEARSGRIELTNAFGVFEAKLDQRFGSFDTALGARFETLQTALVGRLDASSKALMDLLTQAQIDAANARTETSQALATFRTEMAVHLGTVAQETGKSRQALADSAVAFEARIQERFEALTAATRGTLDSLKSDITNQLGVMSTAMKEQLEGNGNQIRNQFSTLQDAVGQQLTAMAQGSQTNSEQLRTTMNERLAAIQKDNTEKLEEMRRTVDEKLHATLEQRLGDSFKLVSERLEQVHVGLGEMKNLAGSVGDLKRVMTNVRTRGTWGEVQLGAIMESLLTAEQFARNVKTVPGSNDLVEFAVRMPGKADDAPVWLPLDSKYPVEHYQRLLDAHETMEKAVIQQAAGAFESSIRAEAKKISSKYVSPPHTTDFAILFLPTEGLFAEVARIPGLVEALQNEHRVVVAGPTTLAAMLNSLRLGFRTLAIEKRSSEVWGILGSVKTEFQKFGDIVDATKKSIDAAAKKFDEVGVRTRAVQRKLRDVQELPVADTPPALDAGDLLILDEDRDVAS